MPPINNEFNEQIKNICEKSPCSCSTILKFKTELKYLYEYIMQFTEKFQDLPFSARIWFTLTGRTEYVKCKLCGKEIPHNRKCRPVHGYDSEFCSNKCAQKSDEHAEYVHKLWLEKYGVDHPSKSQEIKLKISESHLSRSPEKISESNEKRYRTNLEKYGTKAPAQSPEIAKKCSLTQKNRSDDEKRMTIEKRKKTFLEKYGDENYHNSKKARETFLKHCTEDPNFEKNIKKQITETNINKYGVPCALMLDSAKKAMVRQRCAKRFENIILKNELVEPLFDETFYVEHFNDRLLWRCRKCGNIFENKILEHQPFIARCEKCFPINIQSSNPEKEIISSLKTKYAGEIIENSRNVINPKELDIYFPDKKLAIEFDGLYWHSENAGTHKNYHVEKTELCENAGIQLVHIFEPEWIFKKTITESRLFGLLGIYEKTIFARKCKILEIPNSVSDEFLESNHIQGKCISKVRIGLYFNDELVSMMTFGKCRFDKKYEWEMLRFCSKLNYHIPGAAGKLLKYFERNYKPMSLVTYADRRWSQGKLYKALGFTLDHISKPDYWYWNHKNASMILESRVKYQKHKLNRILEKFDKNKSEFQNMTDNGYYRIFDCGNYVFKKIYEKS